MILIGEKLVLKIFNYVSDRKEVFKPLSGKTVRIYVCGITPYDVTHLGHAFTYVSFDVLIRYLSYKGYKVNYTQNVTDIDDDILRKSKEQGKNWKAFGTFWTNQYLKDIKGINLMKPTHYVKATETMDRIIKIVGTLMRKGFAYESHENVYFDVKKFPSYGKLAKYSPSKMKTLLKERGGDPGDPKKRNPLDFILWQKSKPGEPVWKAPWGDGRPGWHIECSAMINKYLGDQIEIHGGGRDLIFPHHESEIAQSESLSGKKPFSKYFMYSAMVMYEDEKMSKSLGNLVLVSDLLKKHSPNTIRWMLMSHQYRRIWEYVDDEIVQAQCCVENIEAYLKHYKNKPGVINKKAMEDFEAAMEDDLNTPESLHIIKTMLKRENESATIRKMMGILGFFV